MSNVTKWVAEKLAQNEQQLKVVNCMSGMSGRPEASDGYTFLVAVLGVQTLFKFRT